MQTGNTTSTGFVPPPPPPPPGGGRRRRRSAKQSAWMAHVKATMRANKGMPLNKVLPIAKQSYKKSMRGGEAEITPAFVGGRRRRSAGKKTRRMGKGLY